MGKAAVAIAINAGVGALCSVGRQTDGHLPFGGGNGSRGSPDVACASRRTLIVRHLSLRRAEGGLSIFGSQAPTVALPSKKSLAREKWL
jgi:hypothetical protein